MDPAEHKLVEVYRARSTPLAHTIRLLLESEGITTFVDGDFLQGALGELPFGAMTDPRVMVKEADEAQARQIIEASEHAQAEALEEEAETTTETEITEHVKCLACGAPMDDQDTCPKCGWSYQQGSHDDTVAS
jgi:hypothetical protein